MRAVLKQRDISRYVESRSPLPAKAANTQALAAFVALERSVTLK
jgi:hypothetical protein